MMQDERHTKDEVDSIGPGPYNNYVTLLFVIPIHQLSLLISEESLLRRPVRAGYAYTPVRAGFVGDTYTPANEMMYMSPAKQACKCCPLPRASEYTLANG